MVEIYFVGKESYKENPNPTDKDLLLELIDKVENIIKKEINKISLETESKPEIELDIDRKDPNLYFSIVYDYELHPNTLIKEVVLRIQEGILKLVKETYKNYPNFYCRCTPWSGGFLNFSIIIRPVRGYYTCPICNMKIEDSEQNYIGDIILRENIAACIGETHKVFFVENLIDTKFDTKEPYIIDEHLKIHVIDPNNRNHRLLAFQLNVLAKEEVPSFLTPNIHKPDSKMYVMTYKGIPIGYIFWNRYGKYRCSRQIFIRKEFRRRGFATKLMEKTVEIECGNEKFVCESPNEQSAGILIKLGYAKRESDGLRGVRCSFIIS